MITWSPYIGSLIGGIAFGFLNQRFTHNNIIFLNVIFYMLFILTSTFGDSFASTSVFIFLSSINASIVILSTYIQGIEMASHTQRAIFGSIVFSGEIACNCLNVIVFMFIIELSWKNILGISILFNSIMELIYFFFTFESPRNLVKKGDFAEAYESLKSIAAFNKNEEEVENLYKSFEFKDLRSFLTKNEKSVVKEPIFTNFKELFIFKDTRSVFLILCVLWFGSNCIYSDISSISKLNGFDYDYYTLHFGFFFVSDIAAVIVVMLIVQIKCIGRKKLLLFFFFFYSLLNLCSLILSLFSSQQRFSLLFSFYTGRFCMTGIKNILFFYSVEIYPTSVRYFGLGLNSSFGYIGKIISTFMTFSTTTVGYIVSISLGLLTGLLCFLLKDTSDTLLAEVVDEKGKNDSLIKKSISIN